MRSPLALAVLVAALSCPAAPAAALRRVYVANLRADTVAVVDADRRTVLREITVGAEPDGVAVSPDGATVYVANYADDSVSVIDTATDSVVATIAVGDGPVGLAVSPDGGEVWVTHKLGGSVGILDTGTRTLIASVGLDAGSGPDAVAFTPDGGRALVTRSFADSVAVIDTQTRRVAASVVVGAGPNRVVVDAAGAYAYVTLFGGVQGENGDISRLAALELSSLSVTARAAGVFRPMGLALAADGRTLFVADSNSISRFTVDPLAFVELVNFGTSVGAIAVLDAPHEIFATLLWQDGLRILPSTVGFVPPPAGSATLAMPAGPYALAALPGRDPTPLIASIDAPGFGLKLDASARAEVRITATAGDAPLGAWSLALRRAGAEEPDRPLASGDTPVRGAVVATLDGATLATGVPWTLVLTVTSPDGPAVVRERAFLVPDRQYAVVPLDGSFVYDQRRVEMSADGQRFVRMVSAYEVAVFEARTAVTEFVRSRQPFVNSERARLSRDGNRLGVLLSGEVAGTFNLGTGSFSLVPYRPYVMDLDAEGRWLAGYRVGNRDERYQLFDLFTGERFLATGIGGEEADCANEDAQWPRISADGTRLAFVTGLELGAGPASGCRLFVYDHPQGAFRMVADLGDHAIEAPSLDDAGAQFATVLRANHRTAGVRRATLFDLASGASTDLLGDHPAQSFDAALSGDGSAVMVSSCADLDASVGNADGNNELFRLDLASGVFTQITDTRGGTVDCGDGGGLAYDPLVSTDGRYLSFPAQDGSEAGLQRSERNGFIFGAVRAVPVAADNTPPKLDIEGELAVLPHDQLTLGARGGDRDGDIPVFFAQMNDAPLRDGRFTLDRNDPRASFNWIPGVDDAGEHVLRIGAFDGRGGETIADVRLAVCRYFVDASDRQVIAEALFAHLPTGCGDADANGDEVLSAADLVAPAAPTSEQ